MVTQQWPDPADPTAAEQPSGYRRGMRVCPKHPRYVTFPFCPDCRSAEEAARGGPDSGGTGSPLVKVTIPADIARTPEIDAYVAALEAALNRVAAASLRDLIAFGQTLMRDGEARVPDA